MQPKLVGKKRPHFAVRTLMKWKATTFCKILPEGKVL
jgi:hypothetical protein